MKKLIISITALLGVMVPSITMAQGTGPEPYAVLSESNTKLTFYYNDNKPSDGMSVGPFSSRSYRDWNSYASTITSVVFDESFANCTSLESTAYWFYDCTNLASITGIEHLNTASVKNMNSMFYRCSKLTSLDVSGFNTSSATNMSFMFFNCSRLETLEVSNFDTSSAKNISGMFYNCSGLTSLDVSHFNTANVTNMSGMFRDCRNLSSLDVSDFNTTNVTDMSSMFYWCSGLTSLDVSSFNTDKVTKISAMFNGCSSLTTLNLSNFNTSNVSDLSEMFQGCLGLTSLDLSSFNTDNVTNMKSMFYNCSSLASLDLSGFNTAKVTTMEYMFGGCSSMTSLDLSNFVTNNVTNMSGMFSGCSGLTSLNISSFNTGSVKAMYEMFKDCSNLPSINLSNFNTENVTNMYWMFGNCSSLTTINLSSFNTTNVIEMTSMFNGCSGLTSIDVSNFNTANVTNMGGLFSGCSGLTSLNLSNFNTNNVTNMAVLFNGCSGLTILDLNNFNTANVTNMSSMFNGCSGLTELDVSNFNTANVKDMTKMFYDCTSLTSIYVDDNWSTEAVTSSNSMFYNCSNLVGGKGTTYISPNYNATYARIDDPDNGNPGYLTDVADKGKVLEPYAVLTDNDDEITTDAGTIKGKTLTFYYDKQKETRSGMDLTYTPWRDDETKETITKVVFDASFADCTSLTTTDSWFNECSNLATIENISNLKTEHVTNMSAMFRMCTSLTSIDFENFNTSNATTLDNMFFGCTGLTNLDLSHFNTANVEDMHSMFAGCTKLTTLDLSHFETSSLTNIQGMFSGCELLETVDLSSWNTASVTDVRFLFNYCTSLTTVYVGSTWDLSSVTTEMGSYVFNNCNNIGGGQGTSYSSSHIDHTYARIDDPDNGNPGYFTDVADKYKVPEPYAVLKENGDEITTDDGTITGKTLTFYYDSKKKDSDFEIVPFSSESDRGWDSERGYITEVEFDASFANCKTLTSTAYWFSYCANLKKITHIEYLVTDDVENMAAMFRGCSDLTDLDFSHFNTANVKDMSELFHTGPKSLDLRSFDTRNVTDMSAMFYYSSVTSLDLSSFDTRNVENMNGMFIQCSSLSTLDLSNFETENVKNMASMFYRCTGLTSLNVSNFNTANVTTMKDMFKGCSHLTTLDLGSFNTGNVKDMSEMFWDCGRLKTIFVSEWNTSALEEGKDKLMFEFSTSLVGGQGTKYSASYTDATYARIDNLPDNPGYFTRSGDEPYKAPEAYAVLSDNNTVLTFYYNKNKGEDAFDVKSFNSITDRGWNDVSSNITKVVFDASFAECTTLTSTAYWFEGFSSLTTFEGSNLVTSRVTNMIAMFSGCSSLTSLDVSSFNTVNVTNMTSMFQDCSNLQTISVGRDWITKKSTNGNNMFSGCTSLVGGAGTSFNSSAVNHYYAHVDGGADNPGYFTLSADAPTKSPEPYALLSDDGKVLSIYYDDMKSSHIILNMISIDEGFMYNNIGWPYGTSQTVTTVIFDPSFADCRLKNLNSMFRGFTKLSNINGIEYLNTSEVTDMYLMFAYCYELKNIDLSNFNTSNAVRMYGMFEYCTSLTALDLSSFNTSKLRDISCMFYGDNALKTIYVGSGWNTSQIINPDSLDMVFKRCENLVGGKGTMYDESRYEYSDTDGAYARIDGSSGKPGYMTDINTRSAYAVLSDENTVMTLYYDGLKGVRGGINIGDWYSFTTSVRSVVFDESFASYTSLTSTSCWFSGFNYLESITGIEHLKTDNVIDMSDMFHYCSVLTSLDLSGFNTSNVTDMSEMFNKCYGLTSLDVSNFNTANVTDMRNMFCGCMSLSSLDVSNFNTGNVTDMGYMFFGCSSLTSLDLSGFNTTNVTNMGYMFDDCYNLSSLDVSGFNTNNVTDMGWMFSDCSRLTSLDMSNFSTINVTNMTGLFSGCSSLTSLDLSSFNTANVTSMTQMFSNCDNLRTIFVGEDWGTTKVNSSLHMFYQCKTLVGGAGTVYDGGHIDKAYARIDGGANSSTPGYFTRSGEEPYRFPEAYAVLTENDDYVTTDEGTLKQKTLTFYYDSHKESRGGMSVGPFALDSDMAWFNQTKSITTVVFDNSFANCTTLTSTAHWFERCSNISSILGIDNLKTDKVTNMARMFEYCSSLTSLDLSGFKTDNVTDMSCMFGNCSGLTSLNISSFNTENVTDMISMFHGCSGLTNLDVTNFKTDNVTDMNGMFSDCSSLKSLDLSGFNTESVTGMQAMFSGCSNLGTIYVGDKWNVSSVTYRLFVFEDCTALVGGAGTPYDPNHTDTEYARIDGGPDSDTPGYFTEKGPEAYAVLTDNEHVIYINEVPINGKTLTFYYDKNKTEREGMSVGPFETWTDRGWNDDRESITSVEFDTSFSKCTTLKSTAYWFEGCTNLTLFSGLDNLKTDNVEDMTCMFANCFYLRYLDISGFNTGKVTSMMGMFYDCNFLETIFVGEKWNTDNLTNLGGNSMFSFCDRLVGGQGTKYADNYINDHTYAHIDEGTSNPGYFTDIKSPYPYAVISDENTKVTFYYDAKRKERNGIWLLYWHKYSESITQVIFESSFAEYKDLPDLECWFAGCSKLTSIEGFSNLNTEKITNMRGMFINCSSLTTLDLSSLNTSNVTTMAQMFQGCSNLESLNISFENTGEVITMQNMFGDCSKLKNLNLSNFNTAKLEVMSNLFSGCSNLESLDISFENTGKVIYMQNVFEGCSKLKSLDLSSFNTENVTHMSGMFSECSSLTDLDLSNFMTNKVEDMSNMFNNCSSLATIYVSSLWNTEAVTESTDMFSGCTSLVGGAGTTYADAYKDVAYAHIDDTSNPGYLTDANSREPYAVLSDNDDEVTVDGIIVNGKTLTFYYDNNRGEDGMDIGPFNYFDTRGWNDADSTITSVVFDASFTSCNSLKSTAYWFHGCKNLTTITGIENLKTDNVTDMNRMFCYCSKLTSLDVSGLNTANVTTMYDMFSGCSSLTSLDLSGFNTSKVTNMGYMFNECSSLTTLDISGFNTDNVTDMNFMFYGCFSLTSLDVSGFNTENVTNMYGMFYDCSGLTSLDVSGFKTDNVTYMGWMFTSCSSLASLDVSGFKTDNVTDMNFMFYGCSSLTSLDVSGFNTENVTGMDCMFFDCSSLTNLDVSGFNTDNVTDMGFMFSGCSSLTSLDVSGFKTDEVTSMKWMFHGCSSLTSLDVSGFNTENVASMVGMFEGCSCLTSLDVSGFNTTNVTDIHRMFYGCSSLTSLDLSSFNISKVEYDADNDCYGIEYMFSGCSALTTIYVGEGWNIENLTESTDVFKDCTALVGGAGTPYDPNHTDTEYARIDDPDNSKPGYFTKAGKLGDVNGDGFVNIADAQAMVSYILGTYEGTFNVSLADMNNDGVIDIFDVTLVVNITLEDDTNNPSGSRAFTRGDNSQAEMIRLKAEANNIYLSIDEAERFTAFQFDITLPEGVELTGVELAAGTTDHMLKFVKHRGNRYRVVGLSFTNELLATSDGKLIMLQVSDAVIENDVSIDNVLFVTPSNKVVTHIGGIEYNQQAEDDTIYNLSGQKLNVKRQQLSKGVYIINHKKVIIK